MVSAFLTENAPNKTKLKHGVVFKENKFTEPKENQSIVQIRAASFNHRDVWILNGVYPSVEYGSILGSDAVAYITKSNSENLSVGQRVLINPGYGWKSDPRGPEDKFYILGLPPTMGTMTEEPIAVDNDELVSCPEHLTHAEAASLPLAGLTAYRALFTQSLVREGDYVLITGIGGGVALFALQFAVAIGAHVYVTSSSQEKIDKAIKMGAKGGVNYKNENFIDELKHQLNGNKLSAIVDGAGGPLYAALPELMRPGGIIANYGHTATPEGVTFNMDHVRENLVWKGSTMGSRREFIEMVKLVEEKKIKPVVSHVWSGLNSDTFDKAINVMNNGHQFGKIVLEFNEHLDKNKS
ncbi:putative zinc-type alcohol dehydrogenase-like protein YogA [Choanephora cucurbitarum]|uniref:Putative zinc-type alcohol dehydrogenase-like protein YogA n=1 Tax=Choanephora cucurbitarum TaxID=101091 RepID=A0A1C7N4V3_9FUNG|nr:putative zinc-type alcohol dehydrogenase-like protein YogA [Choanephora cucurbitarum]